MSKRTQITCINNLLDFVDAESTDRQNLLEVLNIISGGTRPTPEQVAVIEDNVLERWEQRRVQLGYSKTTKTGKAHQMEFLMGMVATLEAIYGNEDGSLISPRVMFSIMRGDYIESKK